MRFPAGILSLGWLPLEVVASIGELDEVQDTLMLFALLVPSMFYHCLENLDGVGVVV